MILRAARRDVEQVGTFAEPSQVTILRCGDGEDDDASLAALQAMHRARAHENTGRAEETASFELAFDADTLTGDSGTPRAVHPTIVSRG